MKKTITRNRVVLPADLPVEREEILGLDAQIDNLIAVGQAVVGCEFVAHSQA